MSVRIHQLELEGFGLYSRPATFALSPELNTFVAANEAGKTTFLAGLTAVLFGLPKSSDPNEWGTARFRSWSEPLHFRGEILLRDETSWHRIRRNFATHEVRWSVAPVREDGRDSESEAGSPIAAAPPDPDDPAWTALFEDEHNPSARGDSVRRYREHLRDLLGLDDADLFRLIYSLTQDPEDRSPEEADFRSRHVPPSVQGLLSGSGRDVREVLTTLFDQFAEITQATKDAGLIRPGSTRALNRRQAGRLEEVREQQDEIRRRLEASRRTLDELHGVAEQLEALRQEIAEAEDALAKSRSLRDAWDRWIRARRDRRGMSEQIVDLEKTLTAAKSEERQVGDAEAELAASFPEYAAPDLDAGALLERLGALAHQTEDLAELDTRARALEQRRTALEQQLADEEPGADPHIAAFHEHPHLERDHARWRQAARELSELDDELARIEADLSAATEQIEALRHWAVLDPEADLARGTVRAAARLRDLREALPQRLGRAEEAEALAREAEELEDRLAGPLKAMAEASPEQRAAAAQFGDRRALHQQELEAARRRLEDLESRMRTYDERMEEVHELEEEVAAYLGPDSPENCWDVIAEKVDQKVRGLQEEAQLLRRMDQDEQELRRGLVRLVGIPAGLGLLGGTLVGALLGHALTGGAQVALAAGLGIVTAAAAGYVGFRQGKGKVSRDVGLARGRLSAVQRTITDLDRQLGEASRPGEGQLDLTSLDLEALTDLRSQLRNYRQHMDDHARQKVFAPSEEELGEARAAFGRAEDELRDLLEQTAELGENPAEAIRAFEQTERRLAEIRPRLADLTAELGPAGGAGVPVAELPASWAEAVRLAETAAAAAAIAGEPAPATGDELRGWLETIEPAAWNEWIEQAEALSDAAARVADLTARRRALLEADKDEATRRAQLTAEVAELAEACRPFTLETEPEDIKTAATRFKELSEERSKAQTLVAECVAAQQALETERKELQASLETAREEAAPYLEPVGGDPARARERLAQASTLRRKREELAARYRAMLQSRDAATLRDLEVKAEELRTESHRIASELHEMEEQYPLFRELAGAEPEDLQARFEAMDSEVEAGRSRLEQLIESRDQLQTRTADARAEGRRVGNVAVLELEAQSLRREEDRLLLERDALQTAFEALQAAEVEFGQTHRQRLEERATEIFREITRTPARAIGLDDSFAIRIVEEDGHACVARQLSQGARDQLALALRLAVAELLTEGRQPPLLLDDPFLAFDEERLAVMRETLSRLAETRQIILLSHRQDLRDWGAPVTPATTLGR